jgi:hypothetical protein
MNLILTIQGWYFLLTGLWPMFHMKSFEYISGYKTDKWLVRTVALMITCSGIIFLKFSDNKAALFLAIINAVSLAAIDIYYVWKRIIRKVYLLDALIEVGFITAYILA